MTVMKYPTGAILFLSMAISAIVAVGTWSFNEDLYVALCAGRDVLAGNLDRPDRWSFTTEGKVWVNQAWLSGLIYYGSYHLFHDLGPILLKAGLLIACLVILFARCRRLGCSVEFSFAALTLGTLAAGPIMSIRPENFGVLYLVLFTTFLVGPNSWGMVRQLGCTAVFLVWCNSHGSFVFGFVLLALKIGLEAARVFVSGRVLRDKKTFAEAVPSSSIRETFAWATCLGFCFLAAALANPYGIANLMMPLTQTGTAAFTEKMPHWAPLIIDLSSLRFAGGKGIWIFLGCLIFTAGLGAAAAVHYARYRPPGVSSDHRTTEMESDLPMEILSFVMLTAVTFRFGRTAVFTSMIMIPTMAFLMQFWWDRFNMRAAKMKLSGVRRVMRAAGPVSATLLLLTVTYVLADSTIIPLLPGNPLLRSNSASARVLGPLSTNTADTVAFLRDNRITGRIFSNYMLADVLLLHVPRIQVFIDCRAQSIYSEKVLNEYERVLELDPSDEKSIADSLAVLDRRHVSAVVIGHYGIETHVHVAEALVRTKEWLPIYVDPYGHGFVFLRKDSDRLRGFLEKGNFDHLQYPDRTSRVLSTAFAFLATNNRVPQHVQTQLHEAARLTPTALIYYALARGTGQTTHCLDPEVRSYLQREDARLSLAAQGNAAATYWTLRSRLEILHMLDRDRKTCERDTDPQAYAVKLWMVQQTIDAIRREFLPWGVNWSLP